MSNYGQQHTYNQKLGLLCLLQQGRKLSKDCGASQLKGHWQELFSGFGCLAHSKDKLGKWKPFLD